MTLREKLTQPNIPADIRLMAINCEDNALFKVEEVLEKRKADLLSKRKIILITLKKYKNKDLAFEICKRDCLIASGSFDNYDADFFFKNVGEVKTEKKEVQNISDGTSIKELKEWFNTTEIPNTCGTSFGYFTNVKENVRGLFEIIDDMTPITKDNIVKAGFLKRYIITFKKAVEYDKTTWNMSREEYEKWVIVEKFKNKTKV